MTPIYYDPLSIGPALAAARLQAPVLTVLQHNSVVRDLAWFLDMIAMPGIIPPPETQVLSKPTPAVAYYWGPTEAYNRKEVHLVGEFPLPGDAGEERTRVWEAIQMVLTRLNKGMEIEEDTQNKAAAANAVLELIGTSAKRAAINVDAIPNGRVHEDPETAKALPLIYDMARAFARRLYYKATQGPAALQTVQAEETVAASAVASLSKDFEAQTTTNRLLGGVVLGIAALGFTAGVMMASDAPGSARDRIDRRISLMSGQAAVRAEARRHARYEARRAKKRGYRQYMAASE